MTDEQIIQEYQAFVNSVNSGGIGEIAQGRFGDILDIIIRQKSKIEKLQTRNDELNILNKTAAQEAIKEFADRLKGYAIGENGSKEKAYFFVEVQDIDNLVKEMMEVDK